MNPMRPVEATEWMESVMEREDGSHRTVLGGETNVYTPAREVVDVAADARVFRCDPGDGKELACEEHFRGQAPAELVYLAANVPKENVAAPAADEHDRECGDAGQVHHHCRARANGVGANLVWVKTQTVGADTTSSETEASADLIAGEVTKVPSVGEVGVDVSSVGGAWVGEDPHDDRCPGMDGAQEWVAGAVHDDRLVPLVIRLEIVSQRARRGLSRLTVRLFRISPLVRRGLGGRSGTLRSACRRKTRHERVGG
jgi:hypothetical protein